MGLVLTGALGQVVGDDGLGHRGRQVGLAAVHGADGGQQFVGLALLEHVAQRAGLQHGEEVLLAVVHGERQHAGTGRALGDLGRRLHAAQVAHGDVHQHHVGLQARDLLDDLAAAAGLADDLNIGMTFQQQPDAGAHQRVIVSDQHAYLAHASLLTLRALRGAGVHSPSTGRSASSRVPAPGRVLT